jgi:hypothetical protein
MSASKKTKNNEASGKSKDQKPSRQKIIYRQALILIVVFIALIAIALTAFFASKMTFRFKWFDAKKVSSISSMTDAKLACDKKVKEKYGSLLQFSSLNNGSSRYEEHFGGYKLFYNVSVYRNEERSSGTKALMFKCYIYTDGGVSETGSVSTGLGPGKASRKIDSNYFGF